MTLTYLTALIAAGCGVFIYDVAKLVRRDFRRKRKLAKETSGEQEN